MKYHDASENIAAYRREIRDIRQKVRAAQAQAEPQEVLDYEFLTRGTGAAVGAVR